MKICIDIQPAIAQRAGVGRYTKALIEHLPAFKYDDELAFFYFDFQHQAALQLPAGADIKACRWVPGRFIQKLWKTINWPPFDLFAGKADLYHFTNFIRPPLASRRARSVVTIYDASFLRFPEAAEPRNLAYLTKHIHKTVRDVDAIITISQFAANEIATLLAVPREKIFPIYPGLAEHIQPPQNSREIVRERFQLRRPYLLNVGTVEPRKNLPFLFEVFEKLPTNDYDLVLTGMRGWKYEPILQRLAASPKKANIHYLEYVDENELAALYTQAKLFVFPSLYEGFGFPPLEAMAYGTPVVSSAAGSLAEVLGDAALVMADYDPNHWVGEITTLLKDTAARAQLRAKGLDHARKYQWCNTARENWAVYRQVLGSHS